MDRRRILSCPLFFPRPVATIASMTTNEVLTGDCARLLADMPEASMTIWKRVKK